MLSNNSRTLLESGKNLLGFSGGVDSSALFYLLLEANIPFDIALVNYKTRAQSDIEETSARNLAEKYGKKLFTTTATLPKANFEKNARDFRYTFFENVIAKNNYDNLILAHQLDDRLEWLLMQLTKGAGVTEILGFSEVETRDSYRIVRPLYDTQKSTLQAYLDTHGYVYFIDDTNLDTSIKRNYFRHNFSNELLKHFGEGIKKSFGFLEEDAHALFEIETIERFEQIYVIKKEGRQRVREIDYCVKRLGYLCSKSQREAIALGDSVVVGGKIAIERDEFFIYVFPFTTCAMPKEFKEQCRIKRITPKLRCKLFTDGNLEGFFEFISRLRKQGA